MARTDVSSSWVLKWDADVIGLAGGLDANSLPLSGDTISFADEILATFSGRQHRRLGSR
ncbi:MAG: hypothetical protein AAFY26_04945 [Cyanobacteria bacterium J06638_22]